MRYRNQEFFNNKDVYLFKTPTGSFESKVEHTKGNWHTIEPPEYKATTLPCKKL